MWDLYRDNTLDREELEHQRINENPSSEGVYSWHQRRKAPIGENKTIEGVVIKLDYKENSFGIRRVMTVKTDSGWSCWGTVPRAIIDVAQGQRVRFTATLKASDKVTFAFTKHPRKAKILQSAKENDTQEESPEARYFRDMELQASHRHDDYYGTNTQFEYSEEARYFRTIAASREESASDFHPADIGNDWDR